MSSVLVEGSSWEDRWPQPLFPGWMHPLHLSRGGQGLSAHHFGLWSLSLPSSRPLMDSTTALSTSETALLFKVGPVHIASLCGRESGPQVSRPCLAHSHASVPHTLSEHRAWCSLLRASELGEQASSPHVPWLSLGRVSWTWSDVI